MMLTLLIRRTTSLLDLSTTIFKLPLFLQIKPYSSSSSSSSFQEKRQLNSDRVVSLLKANGFTENQIAKLTRFRHTTLFANPEKILAPKIDFLRSIGLSNTDVPKILSSNPWLLGHSLENQLIPCHNYLKSRLHTDENVVKTIKRQSFILTCNVDKTLVPILNSLTELGIPESQIHHMLLQSPGAFLLSPTLFQSKVQEALRLGFGPLDSSFLFAIYSLCTMSKATFDTKWAAYKKWNLSDDEIQKAFQTNPWCMKLSVEKITRGMDFLVNKMGFEAVKIAAWPGALFFSLEKRIIPRSRVIRVLISKGVLKNDASMTSFLNPSETKFLAKFVTKYEDRVPGLLNIYKGKKDCSETTGIAFEP